MMMTRISGSEEVKQERLTHDSQAGNSTIEHEDCKDIEG